MEQELSPWHLLYKPAFTESMKPQHLHLPACQQTRTSELLLIHPDQEAVQSTVWSLAETQVLGIRCLPNSTLHGRRFFGTQHKEPEQPGPDDALPEATKSQRSKGLQSEPQTLSKGSTRLNLLCLPRSYLLGVSKC